MGATKATQTQHPWRAVIRTVFQLVVGLAAGWATVVDLLGLDPSWHWVAVGGAAAAIITRVMADPRVDNLLRQFVPWLAAKPRAY